jgi:hypothetical protein
MRSERRLFREEEERRRKLHADAEAWNQCKVLREFVEKLDHHWTLKWKGKLREEDSLWLAQAKACADFLESLKVNSVNVFIDVRRHTKSE